MQKGKRDIVLILSILSMIAQKYASILQKATVVLFGETHGFATIEQELFTEVTKLFRPTQILFERLENTSALTKTSKEKILAHNDNEPFSLLTTYGDLRAVVSVALENSIPIRGCDLPNLGREKPIPTDPLQLKDEIAFEELIDRKRDREHTACLREALKQSGARILLVCGAFHVQPNTLLRKEFPHAITILPHHNGNYFFDGTINPDEVEFAFIQK
jgi:hypothetical protein